MTVWSCDIVRLRFSLFFFFLTSVVGFVLLFLGHFDKRGEYPFLDSAFIGGGGKPRSYMTSLFEFESIAMDSMLGFG